MIDRPPDCLQCERMEWPYKRCTAFPGGIPDAIYYDGKSHKEPIAGDRGIVFEQASKATIQERGVKLEHGPDRGTAEAS